MDLDTMIGTSNEFFFNSITRITFNAISNYKYAEGNHSDLMSYMPNRSIVMSFSIICFSIIIYYRQNIIH